MRTEKAGDRWDISGKPATKTKHEILRKYFDVWLKMWSAPNQKWVAKDWYVMDLFAGRGAYNDNGQIVSGSPLIFLEAINERRDKLRPNCRKIKLFFAEENKNSFDCLKENVAQFMADNPQMEGIVEIEYFSDDCNEIIEEILGRMENTGKHPLFAFIDPWGINIWKTTMLEILSLNNRIDIMFNYMLQGVRREAGIAQKAHYGGQLTGQERGTLETFRRFIGDIDVVDKGDRDILSAYVNSLFTPQRLNVAAYDMEYPDRTDTSYYLLFASRNPKVAEIVKDIYAKQKELSIQPSLFGRDFYREDITMFTP